MLYTGPIHSVTFSNWQRSNLETLTAYVERLPADYAHFNMGLYFHGDEAAYQSGRPLHECGTGACFLGHAIGAGIKAPVDEWEGKALIDWSSFSNDFVSDDDDLRAWGWLFSSDWSLADDSPRGAAQRSRLMLHHGGFPEIYRGPMSSFSASLALVEIYNQPEYSLVEA
jgi:hypothetical protein